MSLNLSDIPTLVELERVLCQGDEEWVVQRLIDRYSLLALYLIRSRTRAEIEGRARRTKLSELFEDQELMAALTLAINLKENGLALQGVVLQVQDERWEELVERLSNLMIGQEDDDRW